MCSQCNEDFENGYDYRMHWEEKHFYPYVKKNGFDYYQAKKDLKKIMAKIITSSYRIKPKKRRPGIHAKSKTSKLKSSKNYSKRYRGQGK